MSKRQRLMLLGLLAAALPFLGFPSDWDTVIYILIGLSIIVIAYRMIPEKTKIAAKDSLPYSEFNNSRRSPHREIANDNPPFPADSGRVGSGAVPQSPITNDSPNNPGN